jgi:hypothetical protein
LDFYSLSDTKFNETMDQIEKFKTHKISKNSFENVFLNKVSSLIQDEDQFRQLIEPFGQI